jgi:REP element-mobilizing transposase RayT
MPIPEKYLADFDEGCFYHVYNRTNNKEKLFISDENRSFFLKRYNEILSPFADTFCWNLLPNHFHFLIQIKTQSEIVAFLNSKPGLTTLPGLTTFERLSTLTPTEKKFVQNKITLSELIEQAFKRFFQSYSLAFNKQHNRKGNLFHRPFKRISIDKDSQFTQTIIYIHANAQHHKLCTDFTQHKWTSWHSMISDMPTQLKRKEVLDWFGGLQQFIDVHKGMSDYYYNTDIGIEE